MSHLQRSFLLGLCLAFALVFLAGCSDEADINTGGNNNTGGNEPEALTVTTLGTNPAFVSGDSALIAVALSKKNVGPGVARYDAGDLTVDNIAVTLNGNDVTARFAKAKPAGTGTALVGLVGGLKEGPNKLTVHSQDGAESSLTLTDYPISGPIFSGPHEEPFICQTQASGLGNPSDSETCAVKTRTEYVYLSESSDTFQTLDPNGSRPNDIATTITSAGNTVPFIVRLETGTINCAIYNIAILDDPEQPRPNLDTNISGWNGRLVYSFGGGCGAGHHQGQIASPPSTLNRAFLAQGYAVATATLNTLQVNCNTTLSAETALMVKEHFTETFGVPIYTIGTGGSGGAIQQYAIADNYPAILDGITPAYSFPDNLILPGTSDCGLMVHYFNNTDVGWSETEKTAASGEGSFESCRSWNASFVPLVDPTTGCDSSIPTDLIYDPASNPDGVRCTQQDHLVNILGVDSETGFAYTPLDNVGVQYGLQALNEGVITEQQFIDLNAKIGGYDIDGNIVSEREKGDVRALQQVFATGQITTAEGGLPTTPVIDWRPYLDLSDGIGNIHTRFYSFSVRQRLIESSGTAGNQVILVEPPEAAAMASPPISALSTVQSMDQWLANIRADGSDTPLTEKIAGDKPSGLTDACFDRNGNKIEHHASYDSDGECNQLYRPFGDPRVGAGQPIALNVLKCQLKPIDMSDYAASVSFSDSQWARLQSIFADGVCDYSKPSVGKVSYQGPWTSSGPPIALSGDT